MSLYDKITDTILSFLPEQISINIFCACFKNAFVLKSVND